MTDLIERLRNFEGSDALGNGDFSLLHEAAAALEAAREDAEKCAAALNVAVLALAHASECNTAYMPAYIHVSKAIDQARGKGVADES